MRGKGQGDSSPPCGPWQGSKLEVQFFAFCWPNYT